jgi:1-acyl-sn-glycerol-3-phosphate acyltransferase
VLPVKSWRDKFFVVQNNFFPSLWIDINSQILKLTTQLKWDVQGEGTLRTDHWYAVIANHRSWADILVVQKLFNRKIPTLKFFLKQELLWMLPLGGLACWMLGFPFMKRHSVSYLKKHPEMKSKDLETAKISCQKFRQVPTAVINYLEGTRFTPEKQQGRHSPYENLLRPKGGGLALVVQELKGYLYDLIDVTIVYDMTNPTFWDFISGKVKKVTVRYSVLPIPAQMYGDYYHNSQFRKEFQNWVNNLWQNKNQQITQLLRDENKYEINNFKNCYS